METDEVEDEEVGLVGGLRALVAATGLAAGKVDGGGTLALSLGFEVVLVTFGFISGTLGIS